MKLLGRLQGYRCYDGCRREFYVEATEEASLCPMCAAPAPAELVGPFLLATLDDLGIAKVITGGRDAK